MYPDYIPTFRTEKAMPRSSSAGFGRTIATAQTIKNALGSVSDIVPLQDAFVRQVERFMRAERKNETILNLYNFTEAHPNEAFVFARIEDAEIPANAEMVLDFIDQDAFHEVKEGVYKLNGFKDGERTSLYVSKDVFDGYNDLFNRTYGEGLSDVADFGRKITSLPKSLITGYNPFFALTNIARDVQTGYINSLESNPVKFVGDLLDAAKQMAQNSDRWKKYRAAGANASTYFANESGFMSAYQKTVVKKGIEKIKAAFSFLGENSEAISRFAEFNRYLNKNGETDANVKKAILAAADVTVNFSRSGPTTKFADSYVIYLNAGIQGLDKMARQIKAAPGKTLAKNAVGIGLAVALLKVLGNEENEHYRNLSNYVKDAYFLIPNAFGERDENGYCTTFIKIPKSREYGVLLVGLAERILRAVDGETDAFEGWKDTALSGVLPNNPLTENIFEPLRATGVIGNATNQDYKGSYIIPQYMLDEPTSEQKDARTSQIGILASEALERLGYDISPMYVDYIIDSYGGDFGKILSDTTSENAGPLMASVGEAASNKFVADPLYQSGVVQRFYNALEDAKGAATKAKREREALGLRIKSDQEREYSRLEKAKAKIADLRKQERKVLAEEKDTKTRKNKIDEIRKKINEIAQGAIG